MRHHFEKTKYVNRALFVLKGITQFKRRKNSRFEYLVKCFIHKIYVFHFIFRCAAIDTQKSNNFSFKK